MKRKILTLLPGIFPVYGLLAQVEQNPQATFIGINPVHTILVESVSQAIDPSVSYLPIHFTVDHSFSKHFGISGLLLYRLDKDGEYFLTHEFGFAAGPSYLSDELKGFYANLKIGVGLSFGKDYNNSDYNRTDLVLQPDIGYYIDFQNGLTFTIGIGMQSLIKLSESYYGYIWEWNFNGRLSHYYLPVVNFTIGYTIR